MIIDFEKAFDSVSWKFINEVLNYFRFGEDIKKWIQVLHTNAVSAIYQGGNLSDFFLNRKGLSSRRSFRSIYIYSVYRGTSNKNKK